MLTPAAADLLKALEARAMESPPKYLLSCFMAQILDTLKVNQTILGISQQKSGEERVDLMDL